MGNNRVISNVWSYMVYCAGLMNLVTGVYRMIMTPPEALELLNIIIGIMLICLSILMNRKVRVGLGMYMLYARYSNLIGNTFIFGGIMLLIIGTSILDGIVYVVVGGLLVVNGTLMMTQVTAIMKSVNELTGYEYYTLK